MSNDPTNPQPCAEHLVIGCEACPPRDSSDYMREASEQDRLLDERITRIRAQADMGVITTREAADQRIEAMEHHLEAVRALRAEYFG